MNKGRIVVVTGAAGGIGSVITRKYLDNGDTVVAVDIDKDAMEDALESDIVNKRASLKLFRLDLSEPTQIVDFAHRVIEEFGRIDILINNAGTNRNTPFETISTEEWNLVMNINLRGPFQLCQAFLSTFRAQGHGRIINISSAAAKVGGTIVGAHYAISKAGILGLTKVLARLLAEANVQVNAICPGPVETAFHANTTAAQRVTITKGIPLARFCRPEEIAAAVWYLSSAEASYITGEVLDVNGGIIMD